ncbi:MULTISPECIES: pentapeptide repeat-containing protein [unclassified Microcoleus]|uniref:pentapeptide repeat-containing protein n=1 Tax=unclassified Microcoleus TaxID=2642155 RepID=UPI002FD2605C
MTVDEALAIVETVLDDDEQLNDVQELIFKQSWEGRQSYEEIAKFSKYDDEYIKAAGYKLWKLLSDAFDEKVKKSNIKAVIKRYLRRHQVTLHRTQVIGVNLSGANLSGARVLLTNLSEADFYQTDLNKSIVTEDKTASDEIIKAEDAHNQGMLSSIEEGIYHWNDLRFHSQEQVKIAEALDRTNTLFFPNSKARLTTPAGRQNQEPDFLIFHQGKWGILEISHSDTEKDETRDRLFASHGISIIHYCDANRCTEEPDRIVQEFLDILSHG